MTMKQIIPIVLLAALAALIVLTVAGQCHAGGKRLQHEKWYQERHCKEMGGQSEVTLPDRTRCDCVTTSHALEFDFGNKWAEAIGQSLNYGMQTGKRPGIVLILERPKDMRYYIRLNSIILHYGLSIDVWIVGPGVVRK